jgi:hypothetical protein
VTTEFEARRSVIWEFMTPARLAGRSYRGKRKRPLELLVHIGRAAEGVGDFVKQRPEKSLPMLQLVALDDDALRLGLPNAYGLEQHAVEQQGEPQAVPRQPSIYRGDIRWPSILQLLLFVLATVCILVFGWDATSKAQFPHMTSTTTTTPTTTTSTTTPTHTTSTMTPTTTTSTMPGNA